MIWPIVDLKDTLPLLSHRLLTPSPPCLVLDLCRELSNRSSSTSPIVVIPAGFQNFEASSSLSACLLMSRKAVGSLLSSLFEDLATMERSLAWLALSRERGAGGSHRGFVMLAFWSRTGVWLVWDLFRATISPSKPSLCVTCEC